MKKLEKLIKKFKKNKTPYNEQVASNHFNYVFIADNSKPLHFECKDSKTGDIVYYSKIKKVLKAIKKLYTTVTKRLF